ARMPLAGTRAGRNLKNFSEFHLKLPINNKTRCEIYPGNRLRRYGLSPVQPGEKLPITTSNQRGNYVTVYYAFSVRAVMRVSEWRGHPRSTGHQ
ncbi:MAG: hypothetical protein KDI38_23190, partial [Calditrichaeota bacterium]|nr:hypothetical protein [Calditrichota bacterium]